MTPDRINSTGQPVIKSEKLINNIRSGNSYERVHTGSYAAMFVQRMIDSANGASHIELESTGDGNYQLTASFPWDGVNGSSSEAPVNSHELDEIQEQLPWQGSDVMFGRLTAAFGSYAGANGALSFLRGAVAGFKLTAMDGPQQTEFEANMATVYSGGQLTLMLNLFRGVAYHGQETCDQTIINYKRRITAASFNQVQASFVGTGQIWTTAEVIAFEHTPATWWFQLPSSILWFKSGPSVLTVSGQKTEVTYSYKSCVASWDGNNEAYSSAALLSF
jgi:hypothetical protein